MSAIHEKSGACLARRVEEATSCWRRGLGLLGRRELPAGAGLWLSPCRSVHTHFMRFAIDVAFLSPQHQVLALYPDLAPWRMTGYLRGALGALELPAGTLAQAGVAVGDRLALRPAAENDDA